MNEVPMVLFAAPIRVKSVIPGETMTYVLPATSAVAITLVVPAMVFHCALVVVPMVCIV